MGYGWLRMVRFDAFVTSFRIEFVCVCASFVSVEFDFDSRQIIPPPNTEPPNLYAVPLAQPFLNCGGERGDLCGPSGSVVLLEAGQQLLEHGVQLR